MTVGDDGHRSYTAKGLPADDVKKADAEFKKGVLRCAEGRRLPAKADPAKMNKPMIIGILVILVSW